MIGKKLKSSRKVRANISLKVIMTETEDTGIDIECIVKPSKEIRNLNINSRLKVMEMCMHSLKKHAEIDFKAHKKAQDKQEKNHPSSPIMKLT